MQTIRIVALLLALVGVSRAALPTIDTQPASSTNCPGTTATFTVAASSDSTTNYQWYYNETNLVADATNSSYAIVGVAAINAGGYSVVVINNDGSVTSVVAQLVVNDPTTASALANATACVGGNASFTTTAGGTGPFTYVWRKDGGAPLAETGNTLALTGVAAVDAGTYSVEVTGACNSVTNSATLTVNALTLASGPSNTNACVGASATFTTVASGTGPFAYQWSKTGVGDILDATNASYVIASVVGGDAGEYCVRVTGACNSVTNCATLTVNPAPTVTVNGAATVCPGTSVILDAVTDATNPAYLWTPGGATTASITNAPGVTTVYTVLVTDGVTGCTNSGSATITVNTLTGISSTIGNNTNCPSTSRTFTATATGTGPFSYVWRRNGTLVQGPDANNSYSIPSVTAGDAGTYSVEVTGLCNSATNSGTLVVIGAPTISSQPASATAPMGNGFVFSVTASTINAGLAPLSYQWSTNGVAVTGATGTSLAISNLTLAQSGMLIQVAVSSCGGTTLSSIATLTVVPVNGISFDFNTPGQFTNAPYNLFGNEWQNNAIVNASPFGPIVPHESPTGGVGVATGSGVLDLLFNNGNDQSSTYLPSTFDFSLHGKSITMSMMTKIKVPTAAQRAIQMALITTNVVGNTMQGVNATDGLGFISVILQSSIINSVTPGYHLRTQVKPIGGTATAEVIPVNSPTNALNTNTWYKMVVKLTNIKNTTANSFSIDATLQDMGTNGMVPGIIALGYSGVQTNAQLVNHARLYFSLRGFENGGQNYWDDIYITTATGPIAFVQEIGNATVTQGKTATFRALVDGDGPYTYQWFKNGVAIPGAGNIKYQTPQLTLADNGAEFSVTVTSTNNSVSSTGIVSVVSDTLDVLSAGSVDGATVGLRFDQPVDKTSAETAANYTINGVPAVGARLRIFDPLNPMQQLRTNATEVVLIPASPVSGVFTVAVSSVTSLSGTPLGNDTAVGESLGLINLDVDPNASRFSRGEINAAQQGTLPGETYSFAPGQAELVSGGNDIFNNFDGFRFVYKQITGDFDIKTRVPYIDLVRTPTKGGFDARVSLDPASPHVGTYANPRLPGRNFIEGGARTNFNQATISWGSQNAVSYPNVWIRFRRAGNTFLRYASTNGINWNLEGQFSASTPNGQGIVFPETLYVGLAGNCNVGGTTIQQHAVAQFDSFGDVAGYPNPLLAITAEPANQSVASGSSATVSGLQVTFTTNGIAVPVTLGEVVFVWQRTNTLSGGWTNVPTSGQTASNLVTGLLFGNDNGAQYRAIVKAAGAASVTSSVVTVTVTDSTPPTVATVHVPTNSPNQVLIYFSENVTDAALNAANYTLTNQITGTIYTIGSASFLSGDRRTVVLTTTENLESSARYALGLTGITDFGGQNIALTTRVFPVSATSGGLNPVVIDYYGSLATAGNLSDLTNNLKFIGDSPDWIMLSNTFNLNGGATGFPTSFLGDNYGVRMRSYFVPPTNGQYVFWWRADDFARFFMNTNAVGSTNPAGRVGSFTLGINNPNYNPSNSFVTPTLVAGQAYYTELLVKEGGGGDGGVLMVTMGGSTNVVPAATNIAPGYLWRYPDGVVPRPKFVYDYFTGLANVGQLQLGGNGSLPDLNYTTNFQAVISGNINGTGYERISGYSTNLANTSLDNYFGRMYTYFVPPTNGNYRFYTRSDDSSTIYMNTNAVNSTDPMGKVLLRGQFAFTNATTLWASPVVVSLVGGQRYYLEGQWRDGTGGDGLTIAVRGAGESAPPSYLDTIPYSMLEFPTNLSRMGAINFNMSGSNGGIAPANPTVTDGQSLTFQAVGVSGAIPYLGAVWAKNGIQQIQSLTWWVSQPLTLADNGAVITFTVSNHFSSATATSIVTVLPDNASPTILTAVASQFGDAVVLTFNEALDSLSAETPGNYSIPGLTIYAASRDDYDGNKVHLRTSPHTPGTVYTVSVSGVKDRSTTGNPIALATKNFTAWGYGGLGSVYVEVYTNTAGTSPDNFFFDPKGIYNLPDYSYYTNVFAAGAFGAHSGLEFWTARVTGLFMPPSNGLYQFYVRGDDGTRLFMNTNGPDANGRVLIARNDGANSATNGVISGYMSGLANGNVGNSASPILSLTNGTPYYMEAIMKEGGGGDYLTVVMRAIDPLTGLPTVPLPGPLLATIPAAGDSLSAGSFQTIGNPDVNQLIVTSAPPATLTVYENDLVELQLVAGAIPVSLTPYVTYQWQRTNEGSGTFTNIPGANTAAYSFFAKLADDAATFRLRASIPGQTYFFQTLMTVLVDVTPPYFVSASARTMSDGKQLVGASFDGPTDAGIATEPSSYYAIDEFFTAVNFTLAQYRPGFPQKILLTVDETSGTLIGNFTLYADYMKDLAATPNEGFSLAVTGAVQNLNEQIVGNIGSIAAGGYNTNAPGLGFAGLSVPTGMYTDTNGGWDVSANGWDIWNTADGFLFGYREVTGNFDIKTRVQKFTGADQWSKAGLMVRPSLTNTSRMFFMCATPPSTPINGQLPNNFFAGQYRDLDGGAPVSVNNTVPPGYPNAWVRLQRSNSVFYGYWSTNGTDWAVLFSRDFAATIQGAFPDAVYVGLGTTSHDQTRSLNNNAYVEYRDLYFPPAAVITTQPEPAFVEVGIHQSVTFSNLTATGDNVRYQWRLNGVAVTDATNAALTLPDTAVAQSGVWTCAAYTDGGGQISSNVVLSVTNVLPVAVADSLVTTQGVTLVFPATDLTVNDTDFENDPVSVLAVFYPRFITNNIDGISNSNLIAGGTMYGSAHTTNGIGNGGTPAISLTDNAANLSGSVVFNQSTPGARVLAFQANFNLRIGDGSAEPADGISFNFGNDLPNAATGGRAAEDGVTVTGLSFSVDNYRFAPYPTGGTATTSGMKIRYNNVDLAGVQIPLWSSPTFIPVEVRVDMAGNLNVIVNGTNVFGNRVIPWTPQAGRFGFFARNGGQFEAHYIDDLNISYIAEDTEKNGLVTLTNGVVAYTPPAINCGLDTFYYLASDGQVGGTNVGTVTVNVQATNGPVLVSCVTNQTLSAGVGCLATLPDLRGQLVVTDCGTLNIGQDPAPGSSLALGNTVVTFNITNSGGFVTNCSATVTVVDDTAPIAVCPANIVAEATGPAGAVVTFTPSGSDNCNLASLVAVPASGSTFPLGVTIVTVTATDDAGLTNACTFTVTVQDTTPPAINCPTNIIAACTSTNGAVVTFTVTSLDLVDPAPTLIVTPPSGSTFPQGTNLVTALTYDAAGNTNTCSFLVIVEDQTAAVLTIAKSGTNVVVCWPQTCTTYILEGAADLTAPISWTPVGLPVDVVGADFCVTIPASEPYKFFRLRKP